jgi:two-component system, LytTR family, response regulator
MNGSLRALIVDDEAPARRKIARLLGRANDMEIAGEAGNAADAIAQIRATAPDVAFLDVQMPDADGFAVLEAIANDAHVPRIVFVTAHDRYALRAFDVCAVDYLLKPFDEERFERALDKLRVAGAARSGAIVPELRALLAELQGTRRYAERLLVSSGERSFFLATREIRRAEAARNYVILHAQETAYELRGTLEGLEEKLDPAQFVRLNRSHLVRIDAIVAMEPWFHGEQRVTLRDGTVLTWSRRYIAKRPDLLERA